LPPYQKTGLIAIHQLPRTPETLWLRILGKGGVQKQAIAELATLPEDNPLRTSALELLYNLQANLAAHQDLEAEDRELIMALAPLYQQQIEAAVQQGREEGIQQGIQQGQRLIIENLLRVRFGQLDEKLAALVEPLSALPPERLTLLILSIVPTIW
jgi:flagellar biosynthesis/type III secretory pathway protein FliH